MATVGNKTRCITCGKDIKAAYKCKGCSQNFCLIHLNDHNRELGQQLDEIEDQRNEFRQILSDQIKDPNKHALFQQINRWEEESIKKINQTANEVRDILIKHTNEHIQKLEVILAKLTEEIKELRNENDFNEININELKTKLKELDEQLHQPTTIKIKEDPSSSSFINQISVTIFSPCLTLANIPINAKWIQHGTNVAGGNGRGSGLNQLYWPLGICVDSNQTIYIADTWNHCIVEWQNGATSGHIVAGGNGQGNRNSQLSRPRNMILDEGNDYLIISDQENKRVVRWSRQNGRNGETIISNINCWGLAMDDYGYLYVSDVDKHEVRRWKIGEKHGTLVASGNGIGKHFDQFNEPLYIFVDQHDSIYVSDYGNHRVMKWIKGAKEGIVVAGGQGPGNSVTQLSYPHGIFVDQFETLYVVDAGNDRVMRWLKDAKEGSVIVGGNGIGKQRNQFNCPTDLSFDRENNLYVLDYGNARVEKFTID